MPSPARFAVNRPSVIFDTQGDETVIIDLTNGHYFRLGREGTALWSRLEGGATTDEVLAACENPDELAGRLPEIVNDLLARGLVVPSDSSDASVAAESGTPWRFEGFDLEEFTDLEDILGLDPIHEVDPERGWPHTAS